MTPASPEAVAAELRGPLLVLAMNRTAAHHSPRSRAVAEGAFAVVDRAVRDTPRDVLLSVRVRHELGVRRFTVLSDIARERDRELEQGP